MSDKKPGPRPSNERGLYAYASGKWGVEYYVGSKRIRRQVGTKAEARKYYQEIQRRKAFGEVLPTEAPTRPTLDQLLRELAEGHHDRNTRRDALKWASALEGMHPEHFTAADLRRWIREAERERQPSTIRRMLDPLRQVYTQGVRRGTIQALDNPFGQVKLPAVVETRENMLEPLQEARLLTELGEHWSAYVEFACLTGMRWAEQTGLTRDDVDLTRGIAWLMRTKSKRRDPKPLSARAVELVREQLNRHSSRWVWCSEKGRQLHASNFSKRIWRPALERAGIEGFTWHDLRHTLASRLVRLGESLYTVQRALGQADQRIAQRYAHLGDVALRGALERVSVEAEGARFAAEMMAWFCSGVTES